MGAAVMPLLVGAGVGAATSAMTGSDPLKGALFGALGGAIVPGAGGMLGGAGRGVAGALGRGATTAAPEVLAGTAARGAAGDFLTAPLAGGQSVRSFLGAVPTQVQNIPRVASSAMGAPEVGLGELISPSVTKDLSFGQRFGYYTAQNPKTAAGILGGLSSMMFSPSQGQRPEPYSGVLTDFYYDPRKSYSSFAAGGGITDALAGDMYAQTPLQQPDYMNPIHMPSGAGTLGAPIAEDQGIGAIPLRQNFSAGGHLGDYSDGGSLLKGPGDGMSDSIPASIGKRQPARLADGEFVIPADVVSHLGNGSTDAGAKQLYDMMDKVRRARTGTTEQGKEINPRRMMPA